MSRRPSFALAVAVVLTPLACKRDAPYGPTAAALARQHAQCRIELPTDDKNLENCRASASWLAVQGKLAEARALNERLCRMGSLMSCYAVLQTGPSAEAAVPSCFDNPYSELYDCPLAFTVVPPGDPRRTALFEQVCDRSPEGCERLIGLELAEAPAAWQRAVGLCTGVVTDEATCQAMVAPPWPSPATSAGLARSNCQTALVRLCHAAAERFGFEDPTQLEARRDLYTRACQMRAADTCWRSDAVTEQLRQRAACAAGDRAACVAVGKAVAGDRRRWDLELPPPTPAAPQPLTP